VEGDLNLVVDRLSPCAVAYVPFIVVFVEGTYIVNAKALEDLSLLLLMWIRTVGNTFMFSDPLSPRLGRKAISSSTNVSSIVFNTVEQPAVQSRSPQAGRRPKGPGTELAKDIERFGFPQNVRHPHRKRTYTSNACHESTLQGACVPTNTGFISSRKQVSAPESAADALDWNFSSISTTQPYPVSTPRRRVPQAPDEEFLRTSRVLRSELQEERPPDRLSVRCGISTRDTLATNLQGEAEPFAVRLTRRRFFDLRR